MSDWDARFSALLRENLPELPEGAAVDSETDLAAAGLDSVHLISLVMSLESEYEVTFADEYFSSDTFATAGAVWRAIQELRHEKKELPRTR